MHFIPYWATVCGGVRANASFWRVVREGNVVKVVVDSVHFGGGDVLTPPLAVPGVEVLVNLLKRVFAEPTLIEVSLVKIFVSVETTTVLGVVNMIELPPDKCVAKIADIVFEGVDLLFPDAFVRSIKIAVDDT